MSLTNATTCNGNENINTDNDILVLKLTPWGDVNETIHRSMYVRKNGRAMHAFSNCSV